MSVVSLAGRILAGTILLGAIASAQEIVSVPSSGLNVQAQSACEAEMLSNTGAREVFSGKAYEALTEIARAYRRAIPHIYVIPGSWNMFYIASSTAVDGRGKILVGEDATKLFAGPALRGFLGHEMAHVVSDTATQGCNDYIVRDPQMEADADALAARTLGRRPVKAFLKRVMGLTEGQNGEAKRRLEVLQRFSVAQEQRHDAGL